MKTFTALFLFSGVGGCALGFRDATARLFGTEGRFRVVGGVDFDARACRDFERLVGAPALAADIARLTPAELRQLCPESPDLAMGSPPCKGASGLLPAEKARSAKYRAMNRLALDWIELMLATWDRPPRLVLIENVPRLKQRAPEMLRRVRSLLRGAGYVLHDGFHECGELGGLAQIRRRYLLVARHPDRCPPLLYQPPRRRVRGCGEVLGELPLPLPGSTAGGPMHRLPRLSWLNWVRLALIPAGGDWRDLEGVLRDGQARREVFRRHHVQRWGEPTSTVAGSGSNGPSAVADPRLPLDACRPGSHHNKYRVEGWDEPAHTVIGATRPGSGAPSVADPRVPLVPVAPPFDHGYGVLRWAEPSSTVAGGSQVGQGAYAVADARVERNFGAGPFGVVPWAEPAGTVTGEGTPSGGRFATADPRLGDQERFRGSYGVSDWDEPSATVTGNGRATSGRFSVGDPRLECAPRAGAYGVLSWQDAAATITGSARLDNGRFAVADPRKPPPSPIVIVAADGTWHRPLTTLELAALQGFPTELGGEPLVLDGESHSRWREAIGNAVPPPTARAIAERMLVALLEADAGAMALHGPDTPVWVEREAVRV